MPAAGNDVITVTRKDVVASGCRRPWKGGCFCLLCDALQGKYFLISLLDLLLQLTSNLALLPPAYKVWQR